MDVGLNIYNLYIYPFYDNLMRQFAVSWRPMWG